MRRGNTTESVGSPACGSEWWKVGITGVAAAMRHQSFLTTRHDHWLQCRPPSRLQAHQCMAPSGQRTSLGLCWERY